MRYDKLKFHIVRDGETIREIMFLYSITEDELKEENRHIRAWDRLIPGTKLKISVLNETDDNDILQMEPFIEDYYPKDINLEMQEEKVNSEEEEKIEEVINDNISEQEIIINNEEINSEEKVNIVSSDEENDKQVYLNKPRMYNNQKRNIVYYPYYVYYPIYSPYYFNYKKGK